jgi:hypothetical protein
MTRELNHVDLCFVIDTTGSMGPFIQAAQQQLLDTMDRLRAESDVDLQVGLVEFRDHPPQDTSFVTRAYPLTTDFKKMQKVINGLKADGGGDGPEAVYDGVDAACGLMKWREHSCRFVLLVGDSPPHGFRTQPQEEPPARGRRRRVDHEDGFPAGCPCGLTAQSVTAKAENQRVTVHALCMGDDPITVESFTEIAIGTGGQCASARNAQEIVGKIIEMLTAEFRDLQFDAQVLTTAQRMKQLDIAAIADALRCPRLQAAAAVARLGRRGFLGGIVKR